MWLDTSQFRHGQSEPGWERYSVRTPALLKKKSRYGNTDKGRSRELSPETENFFLEDLWHRVVTFRSPWKPRDSPPLFQPGHHPGCSIARWNVMNRSHRIKTSVKNTTRQALTWREEEARPARKHPVPGSPGRHQETGIRFVSDRKDSRWRWWVAYTLCGVWGV